MDLLTQGLVGSAVAQSFCEPKNQHRAALCGAIAGLAPDLDALISSSADPLLNLDYHRHFSHALAFIPLGASIVALLIWFLSRRRLPFRETWISCFLGYSTHGLLDACTSYGTHFLWPFSLEKVSWNLVSIIDPFFSLPLLILIILGVWRRRIWAPRAAVLFCLSYLFFAASQHRMAEIAQTKLISMRDHVATKHIVKPSIGNIFLHRSVYLHNGVYYVDAIHVFPGLSTKIYAGGEVEALNTKEVFPQLKENTRQAKDVSRFNKFSDGYLCQHPELDEVIGDIRFAMLPTSVSPLWGIKIDPDNPDQSPELVKYRQIEQGDLDSFFRMLFRRSDSSKTRGSVEK